MTYRILVTGSRDWKDSGVIWDTLSTIVNKHKHAHDFVLVSGYCETGADSIAEEYCEINEIPIERHPADWSKGRSAGPIRNKQMVNLGADICIAFIKNNSRGASGTANLAEEANIPTYRFIQSYPTVN